MILHPRPRTSWHLGKDWRYTRLSEDGRILAAVRRDKVSLRDVVTGEERAEVKLGFDYEYPFMWLAPDGQTVVYREDYQNGGHSPDFHIWNTRIGYQTVQHPHGVITSVLAFSGDSQIVVIGGQSPSGRNWEGMLWDLNTGKERTGPWDRTELYGVTCLRDGRLVAVENNKDETSTVWDLGRQSEICRLDSGTFDVIFAADGSLLATHKDSDPLKLWDLNSGKLIGTMQLPGKSIYPMQLSPDGSMLLTGTKGEMGADVLWDIACQPPQRLDVVGPGLFFSRDSQWYASDNDDSGNESELCKARTPYKRLSYFHGFSPDSRLIKLKALPREKIAAKVFGYFGQEITVSTSRDDLLLCDVATEQEVLRFEYSKECAFLPDGKSLFVQRYDGVIQIWDMPPRRSPWVDYGLPALVLLIVVADWCYWRWSFR